MSILDSRASAAARKAYGCWSGRLIFENQERVLEFLRRRGVDPEGVTEIRYLGTRIVVGMKAGERFELR